MRGLGALGETGSFTSIAGPIGFRTAGAIFGTGGIFGAAVSFGAGATTGGGVGNTGFDDDPAVEIGGMRDGRPEISASLHLGDADTRTEVCGFYKARYSDCVRIRSRISPFFDSHS